VLYEMATGHRAFGGETQAILHEAILTTEAVPAHDLNSALPPELCEIIGKALEKDRDRRYQTTAEMHAGLQDLKEDSATRRRYPMPPDRFRRLKTLASRTKRVWLPATAVLLCAALVAGVLHYRARRAERLTQTDTVVLADFSNSTGDPVFDDSLRTALSVSLGQSPFLNVLSDHKIAEELKLMTRPADTKLTPEMARDLCLRAGSKAYIAGAIASLGNEYVLWLNAVNCQTGGTLAQEQVTAGDKEKVLNALGDASSKLRVKLGESVATVRKFDAPLANVTTPSLEALKAYSSGLKANGKGQDDSIPLFKQAIELDPNFAMAYNALAVCYENLGEHSRSIEYVKKAYDLREHLSESERFGLATNYFFSGLGDLPKAVEAGEAWTRAYPNNGFAYGNLAVVFATMGQWEKALAASKEAVRLAPNAPIVLANLIWSYMALDRFEEAAATLQEGSDRKLDSEILRRYRYALAFVRSDSADMERQLAWAAQHPQTQDGLLASEADTEAYYGKVAKSRAASQKAVQSALRADANESAGTWQGYQALWAAEFGNTGEARAAADEALRLAPETYYPRQLSAMALSRTGKVAAAQKLADELAKDYPADTGMQNFFLPALRASIALNSHHPEQAIDFLRPASEYELGRSYPAFEAEALYPAYLRGLAFLMMGKGTEAAAEFQKLIDHRGIVLNSPLGALAHLQMGRAYAIAGETAKAKAAYQDFLTLWKDADPDIPIYKEAKAEYARLQ
jgi:eukaryotic-like serine/threonine-protein kinase